MKDVFAAILEHYSGDPVLSGLAPLRRYRARSNKKVDPLPYVVLHLVSGKPVLKFASYEVSEKPVMQFSIWAETEEAADSILGALKSRFDNAPLSYPGSFCLRQNVVGDVDEEGVWYYHVDYLIDNMS